MKPNRYTLITITTKWGNKSVRAHIARVVAHDKDIFEDAHEYLVSLGADRMMNTYFMREGKIQLHISDVRVIPLDTYLLIQSKQS